MKIRFNYILIISLFFIIGSSSSYSQIKKIYNIAGLHNGKAAQGMAIHKGLAVVLNNGGYCRLYDLKKGEVISEFNLASADKDNHANCASFGIQYPIGNSRYPALYISECGGQNRCFVESISAKGSILIQTISIDTKGRERNSLNWVVDRVNKCIYTIARPSNEVDSIGNRVYLITKFLLPELNKANVILAEKDIEDQFEIQFPNLLQGATIYKNKLYLPVGLHDAQKYKGRKNRERALIIINLKKKKIEKKLILEDDMRNEPEDADFYKGNLLIFCGQEGGLYHIPSKRMKK